MKKTQMKPSYEALEEKVKSLERVEAELDRVRQRLAGVTEMARLAYWEHDIINDIYTFNDQFYSIFRTTAAAEGGYQMTSEQYIRRFVHPDDIPALRPEVRKTIESGYSRPDRQIEHRIVFPDGSTGYIAVSFFLVTDTGGIPARAYGVTQDITDRKRAEIALKDEFTRQRILFQQSRDGIVVLDQNAKVIDSNPQFAHMLGYSLEETRALHIWDWDARLSKAELLEMVEAIDEAGSYLETQHRRKDGSLIWVGISANGVEYRGQKLVFAAHRDITERKQVERERQAHLRFVECMDRVHQAVQGKDDAELAMQSILDVILSTFQCDRAFLLYPCDPEAPSYRVPIERDTPDYPGIPDSRVDIPMDPDSAEMMRALRRTDAPITFGTGNPYPIEGVIADRYGVQSMMATALYPKTDEPWAFGIHQCARPRVWTEEEKKLFQEIGRRLGNMLTSLLAHRDLRKNEAFLNSIVENIPDTIFVKDAASLNILRINRAGEKMLGLPRKKLIGKNSHELAPAGEADRITRQERAALEGRHLVKIPEETILTSTGEQKILHTKLMPLLDETGTPQYLLGISQDITELKMLQAQLVQSQKLEAIGAMSGGIAHDFNNILQPMVAFCELLQEDLPKDAHCRTFVDGIMNSTQRAKELVNRILAFGRRTEREKTPVLLQELIKEATDLGRSIIPSNIEIHQDIQPECSAVIADATQMHQIVMNLMVNSYHAMESGGEILIRLRETILEKEDVAKMPLPPGRYVLLSVSDTGCGIEPAIIDKIFDPYFTTKAQERGTGLGLSVVYGIVKEHQGHITVTSSLGKGTRIDIYFPVRDETSDPTRQAATAQQYPTGTEHILLVDDEEMVIVPEKMMLERLGYRVTSRAGSIEALKTFRESPHLFDLVITDMTMPKMTGDLLARELTAIRPGVPIIICSGFNEKIPPDVVRPEGVKAFLMKPVSVSEMSSTVRKVLDGAG